MKKIIVVGIITILILLIYNTFKDNKTYYVSISDTIGSNYTYRDYIKDYLDELGVLENYTNISGSDYRITDIIRNIEDNKEYGGKSIKNILIKADILTLSIGNSDLINKLDYYNTSNIYNYIDTYLSDMNKLFNLLREYDKEKIIMIGYYDPYDEKYDDIIKYINSKVEELSKKYYIDYIDVSDMNKYLNNGSIDIEGEHIIFDRIRSIIDVKIKRK